MEFIGSVLADLYPWSKSLHIIAVITWMAGIFYLPRLYVYHTENDAVTGEVDQLFQTMERKLFKFIMNPSLVAVWLFGLILVFTPGIVDWGLVWPWAKAGAVIGMTWFHHWLGQRRKEFVEGRNTRSGRTYRMMNEVPTLFLLVIVFAVVLKF